MRLSCLQENLAKGLSIVSRAVSTRSTLPVLGNVLLATDDGRLKLSATNLEIVITCWIGAKVEEEGSITVPARTFNDLVSTLPPERIDLTLDKKTQTLHLVSPRSEANIKGIDAQEFPLVPEASEERQLRIETAILKQMISQVAFAAATDDARPTLTGVLTRFEGNKMTLAATDGFRLSVRSAQLPNPVPQPFEIIIPARALNELARIAGDDTEAVNISMPEGRNQIVFDMDNVVLVSQLIDGNFPDFTPVIPRRHSTRTVLSTAEFAKACKMAEIFAREANQTARVRVEPGNELMPGYAIISATSAETGDNVAQIDANVEGEEVEIAFNVRYVGQVLSVLNTPQVALETTKSTEPGVLKPVGNDDYVHIIMPMHFGR
ncbi:MAG: DNA polymerase III subunit beta [Chloroflexi bacterium]|nr:DNA polymerase III subunit beta [Chloroflexota bacterium]MCI0580534.1 DNA polymerase III subunit beta [Chloroflexota bacterium]MCI0648115.1 DNA polymerase III subunit beta [Chloroflexota bacterium]MCI0725463.1 DNA polymerase III subunit beta [Chloroflexota bacterium]